MPSCTAALSRVLPAITSPEGLATNAVEWVPIADLFGNPANPRHNDQSVEPVAASLRRFGRQHPVWT